MGLLCLVAGFHCASALDELRVPAAAGKEEDGREARRCRHKWQTDVRYNGTCPYGWAGPGEVTWPDYRKADRFGATLDQSLVSNVGPVFLGVCIFYSYVLYLVVGVSVVRLLWLRGTRELIFVVFFVCYIIFQEVLVKPNIGQPRPEMSCLTTCGMPSSHSALSIGTLTLFVGDAALRASPRRHSTCLMAPGYFARLLELHPAQPQELHRGTSLYTAIMQFVRDLTSFQFDEPPNSKIIVEAFCYAVLLLPVPWSRVQLADHTEVQVFVGSACGFVAATLWIALTHNITKKFNHRIGQTCGPFQHNLAMPCGRALLQRMDPESGKALLRWYEEQTLQRLCWLEERQALTEEENEFLKLRWCTLYELMGLDADEVAQDSSEAWRRRRSEFRRIAAEGLEANASPMRIRRGYNGQSNGGGSSVELPSRTAHV